MKKKEEKLRPLKITKDCMQAAITFDSIAVIHSDQSLWLLHPFTSQMCQKLRKRLRDHQQPYWDEQEFGPKPTFKRIMENVANVSATAMIMTVVKEDGTLWIWNRMESGHEDVPDFVKIADKIKTAEAGEGVLLAISQDETLWCWKKQEQGYYDQAPKKIMEHVIQTSVGVGHYAALKRDGSLWMWGKNDCGQLGDGTYIDRKTPEKIMEHVIQVSLGARHSAAVDEKHRLWMWGDNTFGQLGRVLLSNRKKPVQVRQRVKKVSLGYSHTGVITLDQQVCMCGYNGKYGCLGVDDIRNRARFGRCGLGMKDLELGADRSLVLDDDWRLFGWA